MRKFKYILLGVLMASFLLSPLTNLIGQDGSIEFLETYTYSEISTLLEPGDHFFHWIQTIPADPASGLLGRCPVENSVELWEYIHDEKFQSLLPKELRFAWGSQPENDQLALYALKQPDPKVHGPSRSDILEVAIQGSNQEGNFDILISFSEKGSREWADLTGKNVGRDIAIVIDGKVYAAPKVRMKITQGKCMISGDFTEQEASELKKLIE